MAKISCIAISALTRTRTLGVKYTYRKDCLGALSTFSAFVYHPHVTILEGEKQALYLTKTVLSDDALPATLPTQELLQPIAKELEGFIKDCVIQSRVYGYQEKIATREYHNTSLTQNMLRVVATQAHKYPELLDRSFTFKPKIAADWRRSRHHIAVRGHPGFLLCSSKPLQLFASKNEIESTFNQPIQDVAPVSPVIDMSRYRVQKDLSYGFHPGSPYPYPHTLFLVDLKAKSRPTSQLLSHAIMYSHAVLRAVAVNEYKIRTDQELIDNPLAMNTIVTNGRMFAFIYYQLNTLNLADNEGIKNVVWIKHSLPLFQKVKKKEGIIRFNQECWQLWLSTIMYGIDLQNISDEYRRIQQLYQRKGDRKAQAVA